MLFYDNLEEIIFHRHEMFDVDELVVLSGYIGPQPVNRLKTLPFNSSVIYGMYGLDSISEKLHYSLNELNNKMTNVNIVYSNLPVHSKCYIWRKNSKIVTALIGSANFSISGLSNPYKEVLAETTFDTFDPLDKYIQTILMNCVPCYDSSIKLKKQPDNIDKISDDTLDSVQKGVCRATLLSKNGEIQLRGGLNWGLSKGHTTIGDAYIKISREYLKMYPDLFPPKQLEESRVKIGGKKGRQNDAVEFIWDDGTIMEGLLEGTQLVDGIPYPKQICSSPKKNILGIYLRNRMGVDLERVITKEDLESYGRTHIDITLQGEGIYYLDFSV